MQQSRILWIEILWLKEEKEDKKHLINKIRGHSPAKRMKKEKNIVDKGFLA